MIKGESYLLGFPENPILPNRVDGSLKLQCNEQSVARL